MMELKEISTKLPTFLLALLQEDTNITLVYQEAIEQNLQAKTQSTEEELSNSLNCSDISEKDLTGSPLEIDLGGHDLSVESIEVEKPKNWTNQETTYYPISEKQARIYLRNALKSINRKPIYCICNDDNEDSNESLIVMGAWRQQNRLLRTMVFASNCQTDNEITTIKYMKNEHLKTVGNSNTEITYSIYNNYYALGYNLRNCTDLQALEINGSISVEMLNITKNPNYQHTTSNKMNCQVIVGHKNSRVYNYWQEVCTLKSYLSIITAPKKNTEATVINTQFTESGQLISQIVKAVENANCWKMDPFEKLDLNNLRSKTILDQIWDILKHCETLGDLLLCFNIFFEEVANQEDKIRYVNDDNTTIGTIVVGLSEGKIAFPKLNVSQCLELLIELGIQKLKNDYFFIITKLYPNFEEKMIKKWQLLCNSVKISSPNGPKRKTRFTLASNDLVIDVTATKQKLAFIDNMHLATEFLLLYNSNADQTVGGFENFFEAVLNKYLVDFSNAGVVATNFKVPKLYEVTVPNCYTNIDKKVSPVAWSVTLKSINGFSETTSIFYFSVTPIIPTNISSKHDIPNTEIDKNELFVTKLTQYCTTI